MKTFTKPEKMVKDSQYQKKRTKSIANLDMNIIDPQIKNLIATLSHLSCCFTIQSCHGHLVTTTNADQLELCPILPEPLPKKALYQVAYIALVIENSPTGIDLYNSLKKIPPHELDFLQFGTATWFSKTLGYSNVYILQASPERHMYLDRFEMEHKEVPNWDDARKFMFESIQKIADRLSLQ